MESSMTKHDLKELAAIGAELGAAKAENEKLREVLSRIANLPMYQCSTENDYRLSAAKAMAVAALSQQAEPTDTYTATDMINQSAQAFRDGQAAVEQAPAQDEREAYSKWRISMEPYGFNGVDAFSAGAAWQRTRPAQTEQQPLFYINPFVVDELEGKRKPSPGGLTWSRTACGHWTFAVYAAPIAQTAPQPEQSGLVGQVCGGDGTHNTVNVAVVGPVPWGDLRIGTPVRLIPAPAQGAGDASA